MLPSLDLSALTPDALAAMPRRAKEELLALLEERERRESRKYFEHMFPDEDVEFQGRIIHSRHKYQKQLEFFKAGAIYRERCFMAANRVGKSQANLYEGRCHLTGRYPHWWEGKRFDRPIRAWAAGKSNETTRDILQAGLLGEVIAEGQRKLVDGTGMIDRAYIGAMTWKRGVADLVDKVLIKHVTGGWSQLGFKSYEQGRGAFEGTAVHLCLLDEEPPLDIYTEILTRTATTGGILTLTFTPLEGLSEVVLSFLPGNMRPGGAK